MNQTPSEAQIQDAYRIAQDRYAALGVDTDQALASLRKYRSACIVGRAMMSAVLRHPAKR